MKKSVIAAATIVALASLTACGGSDESKAAAKEKKEVTSTLAESFVTTGSAAGTDSPLDESEAKCFASDFVDAAGVDKLKSSKLITEDGELGQTDVRFDESLAQDYASAYLECVDFQAEQAQAIAATDPKVDAKALKKCLDEQMPDSAVKEMIVASYTSSDTETLESSSQKIEDCKDSSKS